MLWFGPLGGVPRRATLLPGPNTLIETDRESESRLSDPLAFLYEPDPAVLRAGLVKTLADQLEAAQLDAENTGPLPVEQLRIPGDVNQDGQPDC